MLKKTLITFLMLSIAVLQGKAQDKELLEWAEKGKVESENYYQEIPFRYVNGYIFIDIIQNGKTYNFLFDTGAEATLIDQSILSDFDHQQFSETKLDGPLVKSQNVNTIILSTIKIGEITFSNTGAVGMDLGFGKEKFCDDLHGIIGSTLMKKSKWQIDYKNRVIKFSNDLSQFDLKDPKYVFETKLPSKGFGTETLDIAINGTTMPFNIDTGNGSHKMVGSPRKFKKAIKRSKALEFGFPNSAKNYYFIPETLLIGGVEFSDQMLSLENEVGNKQLLGNPFFENFLVTIDWENHLLYLEPQGEMDQDNLYGFPLRFKANFNSNKIEIVSGVSKFLKTHKIEEGTVLSKVESYDVSNMQDREFCKFWSNEWEELITKDRIHITLLHNGKEEEIILTKDKLFS